MPGQARHDREKSLLLWCSIVPVAYRYKKKSGLFPYIILIHSHITSAQQTADHPPKAHTAMVPVSRSSAYTP